MPYFSQRQGINNNIKGFGLAKIKEFILDTYLSFEKGDYFYEAFGKYFVNGHVTGEIKNVEIDIMIKLRKEYLWPIDGRIYDYAEDDLFDIIEYLHENISKPIDGKIHKYTGNMLWNEFDKKGGQTIFRAKVNEILAAYENPFELSSQGRILSKAPSGFDAIFKAALPTKDLTIAQKVEAATVRYRRHGASIDDRRDAVRELADILEYLRPQGKIVMGRKDDTVLFEIANKFSIRHFNQSQHADYDSEWLSWIFYVYLSTIHLILRKIEKAEKQTVQSASAKPTGL